MNINLSTLVTRFRGKKKNLAMLNTTVFKMSMTWDIYLVSLLI